jgi:hypothetical protein
MTDRSIRLPAVHLSDDQLLLYASGEQDTPIEQRTHVESCSQCKARLERLQSAMTEIAQAQKIASDMDLPSAAGPRSLLKAQLADLSAHQSSSGVSSTAALPLLSWRHAIVFAALALAVIFVAYRGRQRTVSSRTFADVSLPDEPDARFTPGAVIAVTRSQVCSVPVDSSPTVPATLKTEVLQLYGVASTRPDAYEVDYLITPQLGGATDVRNLWPEPYDHTVWNAHVKDRLEDRLREMVCHGDLDLATAQRDISTDWIAAYRKYFHVDAPDLTGSS